jgi:hypothetical protein
MPVAVRLSGATWSFSYVLDSAAPHGRSFAASAAALAEDYDGWKRV